MRRSALALIFFSLAQLALAADPNPEAALLRERADRITLQLQADAQKMQEFRGALLLARMADAWKNADPGRSRRFLGEAVSIVSEPEKNESDEHLAKRLGAGGRLLDVIGETDPKLALRLAHALAGRAADIPARGASPELLQARADVASWTRNLTMSLAHSDPQGAATLVGDLIRLRDGFQLPWAILDIATTDSKLADQMYAKAAAAARADFDFDMLFGLIQLPYPYVTGAPVPKFVTPAMKTEAANLLAAFMLRPMDTPEQRQDVCRAAGIATKVLPSLPPDLASPVANAVDLCKSTPTKEASSFTAFNNEADTVDENLRLAENATDAKLRAHYKLAAARIAYHGGKDPQRALDILSGMTDDERAASPMMFDSQWQNFAMSAIGELRKRHDSPAIERILDDTPDGLRAHITIISAMASLHDNPDWARFEAGQALRIIQEFPPDNDYVYAELLRLYSDAAPDDAILALRIVVTALNNFRPMTDEEARKKGYRPGYMTENMEPLRGAGTVLLRLDENTADAILLDFTSPAYRALFRLGLLYAVLDQYEAQLKKPQKPTAKLEP